MKAPLRFYGLSLLLVVAVLGVSLCRPRWLEGLGFDLAPLSGSGASCTSGYLEPDPRATVPLQRSVAKKQVAARLIDGKLSLWEAAARFGELNAEPADCPEVGLWLVPGDSDEEKLCRQVLLYVRRQLAETSSPSEAERFLGLLEADLAVRLRRYGRIHPPEAR